MIRQSMKFLSFRCNSVVNDGRIVNEKKDIVAGIKFDLNIDYFPCDRCWKVVEFNNSYVCEFSFSSIFRAISWLIILVSGK